MGERRGLHTFLCTFALLLTATIAPSPLLAAAAPSDHFPLAEIERGHRGYGLSVFEGREPQRFDVEVIGVWENVQPETSYILARLSGQGLEDTGVIAGMSGSPVFIDERIAGAVAFAWPFSRHAIAGITPIESMRRLTDIEVPARAAAAAPPVDLQAIALRQVEPDALAESLRQLRPARMGDGTAALQWTAGGFGEAGRRLLEQSLGGVASAGQVVGYPQPLRRGDAVAAVLIDGDLRLASSGTVTDRYGDAVLAFGHPFMALGSMAVPMANAEVVTVVSSLANSFKVTNLGEVIGAFDFDHAVGIRGRVGATAPTIPLRVRLRGQDERQVDVRLASLDMMTPVLAAVAILGALDTATGAVGSESLDLVGDFDLGKAGRLSIDQSFDGPNAMLDAALYVYAMTGYLLQNDLEDIELGSIDIGIRRHLEPRRLRLVGAHAARSVVRPGETVALNLDLAEYRGGTIRKSVEIELPTNLPAGRYSLLVGDGSSIDAARLAIEPVEPVNFRQALEFLDGLHSRRELIVLGVFSEPGLSVAGESLPRLPASVRSLWGAAPSGSARPLRLAIAQQQRLRLEEPVEGILRIDLEVERRQPWLPDAANGSSSPVGGSQATVPGTAGG